MAAPAAQAEAQPIKRVTLATGFDFATAYMFRGIFQEDHGTIVPPYVDVGVVLYQGTGTLKNVTANGGNWNSLHSGPSGNAGHGNAWYEADYYGSVTFTRRRTGSPARCSRRTRVRMTSSRRCTSWQRVLAYDDSGQRVSAVAEGARGVRAPGAGRRRRQQGHVPWNSGSGRASS